MRKIIPLILAGLFLLTACGVKRDAIGEPDELIVIADSTDWIIMEHQIREVFAPEISTPQDESWYNIQHVLPRNAQNFFDYKNILLASLLREGSPSLELIQRLFSERLVARMQSGEQPIAYKKDQWRDEQVFLILTIPGVQQFDEVLQNRGEELRGYFDEMFVQRQKKYLYDRYEQKKMSRKFQEMYDWSFRVPRDYVILHNRPDSNFVWFGRHLPIRWISVYWEETDHPIEVDSSLALRLRRTVGMEHYGNIATDTNYVRTDEATIDGQSAVHIRGIWAHTKEAKGGSFTGYTYYDPQTGRLYYLDGQIFAPGMKKLVYLRQLDIVLKTFTSGVE
ncbi:MAG: hypothetical protein MAGBODY4_01632 [Candidatus Marinimicrobia bacterium]|nr:hypothetical protein [Candidatus Neomarinimicrobiota bacterium]